MRRKLNHRKTRYFPYLIENCCFGFFFNYNTQCYQNYGEIGTLLPCLKKYNLWNLSGGQCDNIYQ